MFPPAIPHVFVEWLTEPGDTVYDPFSGRGTTAFEACLMGRTGVGGDANPLAWLLTSAKVNPPPLSDLARRLRELRSRQRIFSVNAAPPEIRMLFAPETLGQLLWLRKELNLRQKADRFLAAVLSGVLHLNADSLGRPRGLTVAMPNTFAMSPAYVAKYIRKHRLTAPEVDVISLLQDRVQQLVWPNDDFRRGRSWMRNVRSTLSWPEEINRPRLIFTSPPYLQVIKYGKYNWIRLWLLGMDGKAVDRQLFASSSLKRYLAFMQCAVSRMRRVLRDDGYICLIIGDVRRGDTHLNLAKAVVSQCLTGTDLRAVGTITDRIPVKHKVSRIWKDNPGRATKTDRILILAAPRAKGPGRIPAPRWASWT
jgi:site-specific DNA-methyltransferase (adenine-specific)